MVKWKDPVPGEAELVEEYRPLAERLARRYSRKTGGKRSEDEATADALVGVLRAVRTFDAARNASMTTYVNRVIRHQMIDGAREDSDRSRHQHDAGVRAPVSLDLDRFRGPGDSGCIRGDHRANRLSDDLAGDDPPPGHALAVLEDLDKALRPLREAQRSAVEFHWLDGRSMRRIGESLGLSESRVSQLISEAGEIVAGAYGALSMRATTVPIDGRLEWLRRAAREQAALHGEPALVVTEPDPGKDYGACASYVTLASMASEWELANHRERIDPPAAAGEVVTGGG